MLEDQETPEWEMQERLSHMAIAVAREQDVHTNHEPQEPAGSMTMRGMWYQWERNSKLREINALLSAVYTFPYFPMSVVNHCQVLSILEKMTQDTG